MTTGDGRGTYVKKRMDDTTLHVEGTRRGLRWMSRLNFGGTGGVERNRRIRPNNRSIVNDDKLYESKEVNKRTNIYRRIDRTPPVSFKTKRVVT